jgi:uncharacterized protein
MRTCDVWDLARRGASLEGELALASLPRLAAQLADAGGTLRYRLSGFVDDRGRPSARLEVDGVVSARCDRCGGPVAVPVGERASFFFVADETALNALPIDEAEEEPLLGSQRFDVVALVEDQAILALPISPRHDHCAGPVLDGGAEAAVEARHPFAVLAALKKKGAG